jgi:DNA-directed RNA polymerase subunit RPC12/RpoP
MELLVEQECPQCGGMVELIESDRLLPCPYCGIKSFLVVRGYPRFVLPAQTADDTLVHVPYLRCKGSVYSCHGSEVSFKLIDFTSLATPLKLLPASLGLRPQAMKMKFASPDNPGRFLKNMVVTNDAVAQAIRRTGLTLNDKITHQAFIGETISLIYLPLRVKDERLFDAITNAPLPLTLTSADFFEPVIDHGDDWKPRMFATICPDCGWNLDGERDSVVLTCRNCNTFWEAAGSGFSKIPFTGVPAREANSTYLPFWKIQVEIDAPRVASYGDFLRATNQPRLAAAKTADTPMNFWIPAFKIKPQTFLRLGSQLTLSQRLLTLQAAYPDRPCHPINLPRNEAIQSLKIMLISTAVNKGDLVQRLPQVEFTVDRAELAFLPFVDNGYSLYQNQTRLNIDRQTLKYGRYL